MSLGPKVYSNNPIVNGRTEVIRIATNADPHTGLWAAIDAATTSNLARATGVLISANVSDIFLTTKNGDPVVAGTGIKIVQNTNLFLPLNASTNNITYEGTTPDVMVFFD